MYKQTSFFKQGGSSQRSNSKSKDMNISPLKLPAGSTGQNTNISNPSSSRKSPSKVQLTLKTEEFSTPTKGYLPVSTNAQAQNSYSNLDAINSSANRVKTQGAARSPQKQIPGVKTGNVKFNGSKTDLNISQQFENSRKGISNQNIDQPDPLTISMKYQQEISTLQPNPQADMSSQILDISQNFTLKKEMSYQEDERVKRSNNTNLQKSASRLDRLDESPKDSGRKFSITNKGIPNLNQQNSLLTSQSQKRESQSNFSLAKTLLKKQGQTSSSEKMNMSMDKGNPMLQSQSKPKYTTNTGNASAYNPEVSSSSKDGNVKVYARFRPNNTVELDLINQGLGQNVIDFIDDKTVTTMMDNQMYTFDRVFRPDILQENVYRTVAVEVVNDVLQGYNGTIFTYGVTGSGKTHTMFGKIQQQELEGIIPRMCTQLFEHVNNEELDIEYIINVSMLEIYKENLYDSLNLGEKIELKIKEHPQKGIIVHGLSQRMIGDEDSLYDIIDFGYNQRQTRATRLNEYSSRSHTVFIVDIQQKLPNGSEKSGKLNLIDLAGSEKVSKSGAVGESLEEAIKINVSLTCLGKVIYALTSGSDYIPYRDSKLTRILQESLGGNYKTSLIVCCSMHSNFQDDTVSTLKFASRAKTIKNTCKVNIKSSPESMKQAIEILKQEVFQAKNLLQIFHSNIADVKDVLEGGSNDPEKMKNIKKALDKLLEIQTDYNPKSYEMGALQAAAGQMGAGGIQGYMATGNASIDILIARVKNRDEEIAALKATVSDMEEKGKNLENELLEVKKSNIKMEGDLNDLRIERNSLNVKLSKEVSKNDFLIFQIEILSKQIQNLVDQVCKSEKRCAEYLQQKKKVIDEKIDNIMKDDLTFAEIKLADYFNNSINFNYDINIDKNSCLNNNININTLNGYKKSIHSSQDSSDSDSDSDNSSFMSSSVQTPLSKKATSNFAGKSNYAPNSGQAPKGVLGIPNTSSFYKGQGSQNASSTHRDDGMKDSFLNNINFNNISDNPNVEMLKRIIEIPQKIDEASQKDPVSKDFMIINLKKSLINAHIINQNLLRTISALEWKQIIEYGKSQLKSNVIKIQGKHIMNLEKVIDENSGNQKHLREKMEEIELEIHLQQKEIKTHTSMSRFTTRKSRIQLPVPQQHRFQGAVKQITQIKNLSPQRRDSVQSTDSKKETKGFGQTVSSQLRIVNPQLSNEEDVAEILDLIDKNVLPLTYENAIADIKKKNGLIKRLINEQPTQQDTVMTQVHQENQTITTLMTENERFRDKIITLTSECEMEQAKTQSYKDALAVERKNLNNFKKLNQEMEISLRNNLKEENESWQNIISTIKEQNEKEMIKRQQDYNVLNEKLNDVLEKSMYKINEMKTRGQTVSINEIEMVIHELQKSKNSVSVSYENKTAAAKRRSLLFTPGMMNPGSTNTMDMLKQIQQLNEQNSSSQI